MKYILALVVYLFCVIQSTEAARFGSLQSFEESDWELDLKGSERRRYEHWIDGGSSAYTVTTESYRGDTSFVIAPISTEEGSIDDDGNYVDSTGEVKPNYGSIYTKPIDFTGVTSARLYFRYLLTNTRTTTQYGDFRIEVSPDAGENFYVIATPNALTPIHSTRVQFVYDMMDDLCDDVNSASRSLCNSIHSRLSPGPMSSSMGAEMLTLCAAQIFSTTVYNRCSSLLSILREGAQNYDISQEDSRQYWSNRIRVDIPAEYRTQHTVLRIKSYFDFELEEKAKAYFDQVFIWTANRGARASLSEDTILPESDDLPSGYEDYLYDHASFDGPVEGGSVVDATQHDWGIWRDGGRNSYLTTFLSYGNDYGLSSSPNNAGAAMKWTYVEGQENEPDPDGSATGEHKPTYSSIVTDNIDFSNYQDLALSFTFVGYGLDISDNEYFEVSISTNAGVDFYPVRQFYVGRDFLNLQRHHVDIFVPGDMTETGRLSQTTQLRIQSHGDTLEDHTYIDDIRVYALGTGSGLAPANNLLDWSGYDEGLTVLTADVTHFPTDASIVPAYDLVNRAFIDPAIYLDGAGDFEGKYGDVSGGTLPCIYGAVEHTDDSHPEFGPHITMETDDTLGKDVFYFHLHQDDHTPLGTSDRAYPTPDTDRCRTDAEPGEDSYKTDRQRMEIKAFSESLEKQLGVEGETHFMSWKMYLPADFAPSDKFTHLHQLKPKGGNNASMPTITLTPVAAKEGEDEGEITTPAQFNLRYSPSTASQVTLTGIDLDNIAGRWVHIVEKVTYGETNEGRYELMILDAADLEGVPIMEFASDSLPTWKGGDYVRPKWGMYRSIAQGDKVKDEEIGFADFVMLEINDASAEFASLRDFAYYANAAAGSSSGTTTPTEATGEIVGTRGSDEIRVSQSITGVVTATVNGTDRTLTSNDLRRLAIYGGAGGDTIIVDQNVEYGELSIYGGNGWDIIVGGQYDDVLSGQNGNDIIIGRSGNDAISGGRHNDYIMPGYGEDAIDGNGGTDHLLEAEYDSRRRRLENRYDSHTDFPLNAQEHYLNTVYDHVVQFKAVSESVVIGAPGEDQTFTVVDTRDAYGAETDPPVESSFSLPTDDKVRAEHAIAIYENADDAAMRAAGLAAINTMLQNDPDTYAKYIIWRTRVDNDVTTVATVNYLYDVFITDYLSSHSDVSYFQYMGNGIFEFNNGDSFESTMSGIEYVDIDWGTPVGTGEGRYNDMEFNWDTFEEEVGYFMVVEFNGKGAFQATYQDAIFSKKRLTQSNNESDKIVYFRKTPSLDGSTRALNDLMNIKFERNDHPVCFRDFIMGEAESCFEYVKSEWYLSDAELIQESSGQLKFRLDMSVEEVDGSDSTTEAIITLIKTGYEPDLSLWVDASGDGDIMAFNYEYAFSLLSLPAVDFEISPVKYLEYMLLATKNFHEKGKDILDYPNRRRNSIYTDHEKELWANMSYMSLTKSLDDDYLDNYVYIDSETGNHYYGFDEAYEYISNTDFIQGRLDHYQEEARRTIFGGVDDKELIAIFINVFLSDERSLELLDIATPEIRNAYFDPILAVQGMFDEPRAQEAANMLTRRQLNLDDSDEVWGRKVAAFDLGDGFGLGVDAFTSTVRIGGAFLGNASRQALYHYDMLNYGPWREYAGIVRDAQRVANPGEIQTILDTLVDQRMAELGTETVNNLQEVNKLLVDFGFFEAADAIGATVALVNRLRNTSEENMDIGTVFAIAGDVLHIAKGSRPLLGVMSFFSSRKQAATGNIIRSMEEANFNVTRAAAEVQAAEGTIETLEDMKSAIERSIEIDQSEYARLNEVYMENLSNETLATQDRLMTQEEIDLAMDDFLDVISPRLEAGELSYAELPDMIQSHMADLAAMRMESRGGAFGPVADEAHQAMEVISARIDASYTRLQGQQMIIESQREVLAERKVIYQEAVESNNLITNLRSQDPEIIAEVTERFTPELVESAAETTSFLPYSFVRAGGVVMKSIGMLAPIADYMYVASTATAAESACSNGKKAICTALIVKGTGLFINASVGLYDFAAWVFAWETLLPAAYSGFFGMGIFAIIMTSQIVEMVVESDPGNVTCPPSATNSQGQCS